MTRAHILTAAITSTVLAVFWFVIMVVGASSTNADGTSSANAGVILLCIAAAAASAYAAFVLFSVFAKGIGASVIVPPAPHFSR